MKREKMIIKRKKITKYLTVFFTVLSVVCLMSSGVVFAISSNILTIKNVFQTDKVNVELKTMTLDSHHTLKELDRSTLIEPGKALSYIPTMTNKGADAYLRVYVHFSENAGLNISELEGISNKWQYNIDDGYFYYKDVVTHNQTVELCKQIHIPNDYDQAGTNFDVAVNVDAIQAKNFKPDFNTNQPWGHVEIKKYNENGVYQYQKSDKNTNAIDITYNGKSNELMSHHDDFFSDLPTLVPGDHYQNTMTVLNNFDQKIKLYFEGHPNKELQIPHDLLKQITLTITSDDGTEIYKGDLSQDIENQVILELEAQQTRQISYAIDFSKDADNAYTNLDNMVNWYFNTSFESKKTDVKNNDKKDSQMKQTKDEKKPVNDIKTGDETHMNTCLILFVSGIVSGICAIYLNYKRCHGDDID